MGRVIPFSSGVSARDRKALIEIVQAAQLAQAYSSYAKADFRSSPEDQRKIVERLRIMSAAAHRLPRKMREQLPTVPWDDLLGAGAMLEGDGWREKLDEVWRLVKKVVPRVVRDIPVAPESTDPHTAFMSAAPSAPRRPSKSSRPRG
jgi:uncharacterized protein with HEPN domain